MKLNYSSVSRNQSLASVHRLYYLAQNNLWDAPGELQWAIEHYGKTPLEPSTEQALVNILSLIYWGELAAWNISCQLAAELTSYEAKMAATAQAHDEARHFTAIEDYLKWRGYLIPMPMASEVSSVLHGIGNSNTLPRKLLGMQLMVEPIALSLIQLLRKQSMCPVLDHILGLIERDEARHVALGTKYLPILLVGISTKERILLWTWQLQILSKEIRALKEMEPDLLLLGIDLDEAFALGEKKQLDCLGEIITGQESETVLTCAKEFVRAKKREVFYGDRPAPLIIVQKLISNFGSRYGVW